MKARSLCRAVLLLALPCWLHAGASKDEAPDVEIHLVVVRADGRGTTPVFDKRIPKPLTKKLQGCHLAYGKYDLDARQARPTGFGREVTFPLPNGETLGVSVSANPSRTHPLRVATRVLDRKKKVIQRIQLLVPYEKTFLIHRPRGSAAVIMGVSAHKPPEKPAKR
jgi:hypothetical protein